MINASELRIGNWIQYQFPGDPESKIHNIQVVSVEFVEMSQHPERYRPITLTAEILERCGFVTNNDHWWQSNGIVLGFISTDKNFQCEVNAGWFGQSKVIDIHFLHQLQNLTFALTGKELEVGF